MYASSLSNTSTEDSVSHDDERLPSFQKEQPNPNPVSKNEQVCANMLLFLKQDCDTSFIKDFNIGSKEPEFTNKKTIKKSTKMKIRHKRCNNACSEHKRKHQRCPPGCFGKQRHQQLVQQQLNHLHQMQQNQFEFPDHQSTHSNHSNQTTPPSSPIPAEQCVAIPIMVPTSLNQVPTVGNLLFFFPICDQRLLQTAFPKLQHQRDQMNLEA